MDGDVERCVVGWMDGGEETGKVRSLDGKIIIPRRSMARIRQKEAGSSNWEDFQKGLGNTEEKVGS